MVNTKHAFWQALILTLVLFSIGLIFGYFFESYRSDTVKSQIIDSEINLLDEQLGSNLGSFNLNCDIRKENLVSFADKVYGEALSLDEEYSSTKLTTMSGLLHKKYDLLRFNLWIESLKFREDCGNKIDAVVYIYTLDSGDAELEGIQNSVSHLLYDLKQKYQNDIILIPIAGNMGLYSVDLVKDSLNVTDTAIVINDKTVIRDNFSTGEVEKYLNS